MKLSKDGQYSAACNKCYEIKHDCFNDTLFEHPNIYFNESVKYRMASSHHGEIYFVFLSLFMCIKQFTILYKI